MCPPPCATGIRRAQYPNPFGGQGNFNDRFNTSYYKQNGPQSQADVSEFSDIGNAAGSDLSYEYAAFLYSCAGGSFQFNIENADDIALAWFGNIACGDFEKNNNQTYASYATGAGNNVYRVNIPAQQYFPIRLIFANAGGPASLTFNITGPNGTVADSLFYPQTCDNSNAFTPFGQENAQGASCANPGPVT